MVVVRPALGWGGTPTVCDAQGFFSLWDVFRLPAGHPLTPDRTGLVPHRSVRRGRDVRIAQVRGDQVVLSALVTADAPQSGYLSLGCAGRCAVFVDGVVLWSGENREWHSRPDTVLVPVQWTEPQHRIDVVVAPRGPRTRVTTRWYTADFDRPSWRFWVTQVPWIAARNRGVLVLDPQPGGDLTARLQFAGGRPWSPARAAVQVRLGDRVEQGQLDWFSPKPDFAVPLPAMDNRATVGDVAVLAFPWFAWRPSNPLAAAWRALVDRGQVAWRHQCAGTPPEVPPVHQVVCSAWAWRLQEVRRCASQMHASDACRRHARILKALATAEGETPSALWRARLRALEGEWAVQSHLDGTWHPVAVSLPRLLRRMDPPPPGRRYPLVVVLHGLNGTPSRALYTALGQLPPEGGSWDRFLKNPPAPRATPFVVAAPEAFGNEGYWTAGEANVLEVIASLQALLPIDPERIHVVGMSLGGTGALSLALRHPGVFASAVPMGGYHNPAYFREVRTYGYAPVDRRTIAYRTNVDWAPNGGALSVLLRHGAHDFPRHSQDAAQALQAAGARVELDIPDAGHNVWDTWFAQDRLHYFAAKHRRRRVARDVMTSPELRHHRNRWMAVWATERCDGTWWQVQGNRAAGTTWRVATDNVTGITIFDSPADRVEVDGVALPADAAFPIHLARTKGAAWHVVSDRGKARRMRGRKRPGLSGPLPDVWRTPVVLVVGSGTRQELEMSRRVARRVARMNRGTTGRWAVLRDVDLTDAVAATHSLVLVGTPSGNAVIRRLGTRLPISVTPDAIAVGDRRFTAPRTAAVFIAPNPEVPDRYVAVFTALSLEGLYYAGHVPSALPDWVVFDADGWNRVGGRVFGRDRTVLAAGYFGCDWRVTAP